MNEKPNIVLDKTLAFSLEIIKFCEELEQSRKFVIANQLLKSGTSIGANVYEAQHSESRADFIHKIKIANKETSETIYWLILCESSESYPGIGDLKIKAEEILKILSKIIITSKKV